MVITDAPRDIIHTTAVTLRNKNGMRSRKIHCRLRKITNTRIGDGHHRYFVYPDTPPLQEIPTGKDKIRNNKMYKDLIIIIYI